MMERTHSTTLSTSRLMPGGELQGQKSGRWVGGGGEMPALVRSASLWDCCWPHGCVPYHSSPFSPLTTVGIFTSGQDPSDFGVRWCACWWDIYQGGVIFSILLYGSETSGVLRPEINGTASWQQIKSRYHPLASAWRQGAPMGHTHPYYRCSCSGCRTGGTGRNLRWVGRPTRWQTKFWGL